MNNTTTLQPLTPHQRRRLRAALIDWALGDGRCARFARDEYEGEGYRIERPAAFIRARLCYN